MRDKKKLLIGILSTLVCIMAVGYALLAQELTINGRASIDSTWKVEITNIQSKDVVGGAVNKVEPTYTATTANFSVGFNQPGDSITYDITVTNKGTLDAVVENITVNKGDNPAIIYTTSGLKRGDKLTKNNGTNTLTVKVDYDSSVTSQPASTTNDIRVTINYQQDLGQVVVYDYVIGDVINFAGSNWRVIKDSTSNEDYVTLMKERVLTNSELGNYAYNGTYDTMSYYWDDNCHSDGYGYPSNDTSNCDNKNSYATSKVKEMLETRYLPTLGDTNLKEVDGYKIRLITTSELNENLGWVNLQSTAQTNNENANVPIWIYQNYGEQSNNVRGYYTMTPSSNSSSEVWAVNDTGNVGPNGVIGGRYGVRPVINLLKSSLE